MRGKALFVYKFLYWGGITPAYAGKSCLTSLKRQWTRDHPRVCGEKYKRYDIDMVEVGSPPRMRGKAMAAVQAILPTRITPAYAGKSLNFLDKVAINEDHPRVCGEKSIIFKQ